MLPNGAGDTNYDEAEGAGGIPFTDKRRVTPDGPVNPGPRSDDDILSDLEFDSIDPELRGDPLAAATAAEAEASDNTGLDGAAGAESPELAAAKAEAADLLDQLQRERASFTNYRNRTQRDLDMAKQRGMEQVLEGMLPVLDSIDRAQAAGELHGSMAAIAEQLDGTLARFGIERYGDVGEVFDPNLHNALMHSPVAEGEEAPAEPTVNLVIDHGYKIGDKVVRAANVGVVGE